MTHVVVNGQPVCVFFPAYILIPTGEVLDVNQYEHQSSSSSGYYELLERFVLFRVSVSPAVFR